MACAPRESVPLLACCEPAMDIVIRTANILSVFDPFATTPLQNVLDQVYDQMLADEFVPGRKLNGVVTLPNDLFVPTCYPGVQFVSAPTPTIAITIQQGSLQATHGFYCNNDTGTRHYWAGKVRFRIPSFRRWCVESCDHVVVPPASSGCPGSSACDPASGNLTNTLFPSAGSFEVIPDRLAVIARPFTNVKHDYTWKRAFNDTEPPASPFCGVP